MQKKSIPQSDEKLKVSRGQNSNISDIGYHAEEISILEDEGNEGQKQVFQMLNENSPVLMTPQMTINQ